MEADAELRAFLRRDEHLAPTGFVTRVISACRNNQELRNDGHCHPAPVTTIEQLKNSSWHYWHNVGKKSVEHLRYLFEKNWEDFNIRQSTGRASGVARHIAGCARA